MYKEGNGRYIERKGRMFLNILYLSHEVISFNLFIFLLLEYIEYQAFISL